MIIAQNKDLNSNIEIHKSKQIISLFGEGDKI